MPVAYFSLEMHNEISSLAVDLLAPLVGIEHRASCVLSEWVITSSQLITNILLAS
jgi:hypothetical protein